MPFIRSTTDERFDDDDDDGNRPTPSPLFDSPLSPSLAAFVPPLLAGTLAVPGLLVSGVDSNDKTAISTHRDSAKVGLSSWRHHLGDSIMFKRQHKRWRWMMSIPVWLMQRICQLDPVHYKATQQIWDLIGPNSDELAPKIRPSLRIDLLGSELGNSIVLSIQSTPRTAIDVVDDNTTDSIIVEHRPEELGTSAAIRPISHFPTRLRASLSLRKPSYPSLVQE